MMSTHIATFATIFFSMILDAAHRPGKARAARRIAGRQNACAHCPGRHTDGDAF